jgi:ABC-type glutathione transport system ATPase component
MSLVDVTAVSKSYAQRGGVWTKAAQNLVVDNVSFTIERGETLGLVGESGSGKSTVARILLGLIPPTSGTVTIDGHSLTGASTRVLRELRRRMQPVFQDPYAALNPRMRVFDIVTEPLVIHGGSDGHSASPAALRQQAAELLRQVGLDESALARYPHEFSGGQRQRINIARALALRPELLILDEPVSALDVSVGAQVVNLLRDLQREFQLTYLFITHSMPLVLYLASRVAVMRQGKIVEIGDAEQVCRAPRNAYTQGLIAATPELPISAPAPR